MSSACFTIAGAAQTSVPQAALSVSTAGNDAGHLSSRELTAVDAASPTDGADLAMWGVAEKSAESRLANSASPMRRLASGIVERSSSLAMMLTQHAMRFLGVPYVFGGTSARGFDCSAYVQHVFAMIGVHLPRTADAQFYAGHRIDGSMAPGDLVFFQTYEPGPSHVGIYLGDDHFVHASSSHGVTVSSLHDRYWAARYLGAKRFI